MRIKDRKGSGGIFRIVILSVVTEGECDYLIV